jgi:dTDP-glucose 4,6-dehydratase
MDAGQTGECFNIGGINEWKNIDIVNLVCKLIDEHFAIHPELKTRFPLAVHAHNGKTSKLITFTKDRPGHDRRYAIDPAKAQKVLEYEPEETFASGIRKTIVWYMQNEQWWMPLLGRAIWKLDSRTV